MLPIIIGMHAIQMLTIEFQSVEVVFFHKSIHQISTIRHHARIDRGKVITVPPSNIMRGLLLGKRNKIGIFFQYFRTRIGSQRSPPKLNFQTIGLHLFHQIDHIPIATGETFGIELPISFGYLITVIDSRPFDAQLFHLRQSP